MTCQRGDSGRQECYKRQTCFILMSKVLYSCSYIVFLTLVDFGRLCCQIKERSFIRIKCCCCRGVSGGDFFWGGGRGVLLAS